ncbi:hypothetical protein HC891_13775 [Candidatus Gracilibacteria bacterium]|nr:hypothetical protein [Candidatus Gracilibacteria bacterium]
MATPAADYDGAWKYVLEQFFPAFLMLFWGNCERSIRQRSKRSRTRLQRSCYCTVTPRRRAVNSKAVCGANLADDLDTWLEAHQTQGD